MRDLFVVVADLDAETVVGTLLTQRQEALGISLDFSPARPPNGDLLRYVNRDSGCYQHAVELLRPPQRTHRHALIVFDHHGSGMEKESAQFVEEIIEKHLRNSGWPEGSAAAVVLEPELESWVWANSQEVANSLGWEGNLQGLREHLGSKELWIQDQLKPCDPKKAMREALWEKRKTGGTASAMTQLAKTVGLGSCQDRAFNKFRRLLMQWFPR